MYGSKHVRKKIIEKEKFRAEADRWWKFDVHDTRNFIFFGRIRWTRKQRAVTKYNIPLTGFRRVKFRKASANRIWELFGTPGNQVKREQNDA